MFGDVAVFHGDLVGAKRAQILQDPATRPFKFDILDQCRERRVAQGK